MTSESIHTKFEGNIVFTEKMKALHARVGKTVRSLEQLERTGVVQFTSAEYGVNLALLWPQHLRFCSTERFWVGDYTRTKNVFGFIE